MEVRSKVGHPPIPTALLPTWFPHLQGEEGGAAGGRRSPRCLRLKSSRLDSWLRNWPSGRKLKIFFIQHLKRERRHSIFCFVSEARPPVEARLKPHLLDNKEPLVLPRPASLPLRAWRPLTRLLLTWDPVDHP